jgi:hypothetical protein
MRPAPLRCTALRPDAPHLTCHAKLADVIPGSVTVATGKEPPPGCICLMCRRCGTHYIVCPVELRYAA